MAGLQGSGRAGWDREREGMYGRKISSFYRTSSLTRAAAQKKASGEGKVSIRQRSLSRESQDGEWLIAVYLALFLFSLVMGRI